MQRFLLNLDIKLYLFPPLDPYSKFSSYYYYNSILFMKLCILNGLRFGELDLFLFLIIILHWLKFTLLLTLVSAESGGVDEVFWYTLLNPELYMLLN